MKKYTEMTKDELMQEKTALEAEYEKIKNLGLSLDMSRGKPGADQLDLSLPMLDVLKSDSDMKSESGLDVRNYACLDGIPEAKALIAGMVGAKPEQAIVMETQVSISCMIRFHVHLSLVFAAIHHGASLTR